MSDLKKRATVKDIDPLIWWDMPRFEMGFPVEIGKAISPFLDVLSAMFTR
jgi:hypothetical protein